MGTGVRAERNKSAESVQPRSSWSRGGCYLLSANTIRGLCPREGAIGPPIRERRPWPRQPADLVLPFRRPADSDSDSSGRRPQYVGGAL